VCEEVVTTPLCPSCVQEAVQEWLQYDAPELLDELAQFSENTTFSLTSTTCIKCKRYVNVCPYCYTQRLHDWLTAWPKLEERFLEFFNFDLWGQGYSSGR
jgi:ferredoxin